MKHPDTTRLQQAVWRLEDLLKNDDGQAWKEARKFLERLKKEQWHEAQPQADALDAARGVSESVTGTSFLQEEDQHLLDRFIETTEDNEGFDIGKDAIKRLANIGVVESLGFGRYGVTMFGYWVHEHHWHQNPSLPLKTNLDRDADARAAIAAAKENK